MKINDICSRFSSGKSISPEKIFETGKYPVYGGNGIRGYSDNYNFNGECAVIGRQGAYCCNVKFFSGKGYMTEHAVIAIGNKNTNTRFLAYKFGMMNFGKYASQSAQPGLSVEMLGNLEIDLPPRETQDRIAALLGALDDKIALNKKINATLEAMAKILYDYWFVQFDFPDENGKPYETSGGKMIYNSELSREIPVGWEVLSLSVIAKVIQGNSPEGSTLNDTGEGMIFFQGKTDFGFRFPEVRIYTTAPYRLAEKFDTLLSVRAPVGDVNMAHAKSCMGRGLAAIHSDYPSFVYYTLKKLKTCFEKIGNTGTTFDSITKDDIMALKVCLPPIRLIKNFENLISKSDEKIFNKTDEIRRLTELRDWLLPLLINGQIQFKEM